MFTLLAPALLAAAVALAVPVLIHLWSRGEGPRVRVGSVRLLEATAAARARRLRLTRPGLLAVRLALLAALVLLLAEPARRAAPAEAAPERWALVAPAVDAGAPDVHAHLASLAADGWSLRRLAPGFPTFDRDAPPAPRDTVVDAWSLLRAADAALPQGSAVAVVAPARLAYARGRRPALAATVTWHAVPDGAPARWIEHARALGDGRTVAVVGADDGVAVARRRLLLEGEASDADVRRVGGTVRLADGTSRPVAAPQDSLRVVLVHDDAHAEDARYVRAALAAAAHDAPPVAVAHRTPERAPAEADLVFWLAAAPPPAALPGLAVVAAPADAVRAASLPRPDGPARRLTYAGRFHPAHDAVVLDAAFPAWVRDLLDAARTPGAAADEARADRRRASLAQLTPRHAAATSEGGDAPARPLRLPLWTLALVLFAVERVLARRP